MSTIYIGGLFTDKTNIFVLKMVFIHGKCMCGGVSKDSWHGTGQVDIQVEVCTILLEYLWLPLHEHLGRE